MPLNESFVGVCLGSGDVISVVANLDELSGS